MKTNMSKGFKRSLTAVAVTVSLGLALPTIAASNTAGSIHGKAAAGSSITYKSDSTGISRTVTANADGRFNVSSVPAGTYTVTDSAGNTRKIQVVIGTGSNVNFSDVEVLTINGQVIASIDTSSVESTSVFTAEEINALPLPRNSVSVALLTPGAIQGGSNFGRNLPSFGGSSIGENGYYIDGLDVTNLRTLLSFANLPQDSIAQTQVKSGGYGVEYGRALGGIINIITKSGTNDWEFGGAAYVSPQSLKATAKDTYDYDNEETSAYNRDDEYSAVKYNVYGGGPLIEDTLFFYTNIEGQKTDSDQYSRKTSYNSTVDTPNYLAKLDWYINEDHLVRFTHINNETEYSRTNYDNATGDEWTGKHGDKTSSYDYESGGSINVLSYTGYMTDDITVNLMYGQLENKYLKVPNLAGDDCPYAWDTTNGVGWGGKTAIGCWNAPVQSKVTDNIDDKDERTSWKVDVSWVLGDHTIKAGYNDELYEATSPGSSYSGGIYYRYFTSVAKDKNLINGVTLPEGTQAVRVITDNKESATFDVENTAWYIEDEWQVSDDLLIYGGLRGETFTNKDGNGDVFIESDNLIAPRVGFSWDMDGDSSRKLFGTLGQYYIPVAANTNIRATRTERYQLDYYEVDGGWDAKGAPLGQLGNKIGQSVSDIQVANPATIADRNLDPMSQLELIFGYQEQFNDDWTLGAKFMGRTVLNGMDDFCGHDGFTRWAADNGYDKFDPNTMSGCMTINPGKDITIAMDLENNGKLVNTTTPASYHGLPEYKRHYLGLEFTAKKAFSDNWHADFSYVLSRTFGNAEGYVNSSLAQEDAGATQDFDHQNFMRGSYGNLPTDRTHQFKAFGAYTINDEVSVSVNLSLVSGTPISCLGYVDKSGTLVGDGGSKYDDGNLQRYGASSFYCVKEDGKDKVQSKRGDGGRTSWLVNTGIGINYKPSWAEGLTLQANIRNVFNTQRPTDINQTADFARDSNKLNPNYLKASGYQAPRRLTLNARYKF